VALDQDALNYPYIRIRDINWLKRTLLIFPHVARIAPSSDAPRDNPDVAEFLELQGRRGPLLRNVDLDSSNIWSEQRELQSRIDEALSVNGDALLARYGRAATLGDQELIRESADVWNDRLDCGRDVPFGTPPAQIRTGPIKASGSYRGCLTRKRCSGHG
jgi:hypothetical protein